MLSSQAQFEQTKQWRGINLGLGLPASSLAAAAVATALAATAGRITAGILAIAAAGFGAVLTTINASHHMNQAAAAANAYLQIDGLHGRQGRFTFPTPAVGERRAPESTVGGTSKTNTA